MAKTAKVLAEEFFELISNYGKSEPDYCKQKLASRFELIYDWAYNQGYSAGKPHAFDQGYHVGYEEGRAAGEQLAQKQITPRPMQLEQKSLPAETTAPAQAAPASGPRKRVYGLPCSKCGAYFTTDEAECPVCKAREQGGHHPNISTIN